MFEDAIEPWEDVQTLAEIGRLLYPGGDDEAAKQSGCLHAVSVVRSVGHYLLLFNFKVNFCLNSLEMFIRAGNLHEI